jgi:flotillin
MMNAAWREAGHSALSIYLIENFEKILASASTGVAKVKIDSLHIIDGGDGKVLSSYIASYPAMLGSIFDAVAQSTGIDIPKAIAGRHEGSASEHERALSPDSMELTASKERI